MPDAVSLLVFSDLDGTLIDHNSYSWDPARDALERLTSVSAGLVLASSKTAREISSIRADMGWEAWPSIVENGAGLLPAFEAEPLQSEDYDQIRAILDGLPLDLRRSFTGFGDLTAHEVAEVTGLDAKAAAQAKERSFSEPGLWTGSAEEKAAFLSLLKASGVTAQQGGRFLTLSFGKNKVDQMRVLIDHYSPQHTLALGDAPNDIDMLETADFGVIIANPHRPPLPLLKGEAQGRISRTTKAGPLGWNGAVLDLIKKLNLG